MTDSFTKKDGNLEPRIHKSLEETDKKSSEVANLNITSSEKFIKIDGNLDPSLFIIVSGGEKREKDYFSFFEKYKFNFPRIIIEFVDKDSNNIGGMDVDKLVEVGDSIKRKKDESKGDDLIDSINLITDVDHFYSQLERNIPVCQEKGLNLIISNPCFEVWLYYSHYDSVPDFSVPTNKLKISSEFKTYLNLKHKGGIDPRKAPRRIGDAIINSEKNYKEDKNSIPELFSTQMNIIAKKLYNLAKEELELLIDKLGNKQNKFINN